MNISIDKLLDKGFFHYPGFDKHKAEVEHQLQAYINKQVIKELEYFALGAFDKIPQQDLLDRIKELKKEVE